MNGPYIYLYVCMSMRAPIDGQWPDCPHYIENTPNIRHTYLEYSKYDLSIKPHTAANG